MSSKGTPKTRRQTRPATTLEGRENQLIGKAVDLVERQLEDGTASAQVLSHFLKRASVREELELEKLRGENQLMLAKIEAMASTKRIEDLYEQALNAMRGYAGQDELDYDD